MKRIVVGADGSADAANAMRWAAELATRSQAEIVVMTGFAPESGTPSDDVETLLAERQRELDSWSEAARLDDLIVRTVVQSDDARPAILRVVRRERADLVVVGRVGSSAGPGILHTGSMAEWLAHNSNLPLAVIGGAVSSTTRSVLLGVDGSEGSKAAVTWIAEDSGLADLEIIAAAVEQPFVEWTTPHSPKNWRRGLEQRIRDDYASDLTSAGVEFRCLALRGSNVANALLQAAKDERADLIVVGTRGVGGFSGLRVGGVALKTLHRADRPVVLVPPPA